MPNDYPIQECADTAEKYIQQGLYVYQKWTCKNCGSRQTMTEPNIFFESGTCEECGKVTDIKAQGCNYLLTTIHFQLKD